MLLYNSEHSYKELLNKDFAVIIIIAFTIVLTQIIKRGKYNFYKAFLFGNNS